MKKLFVFCLILLFVSIKLRAQSIDSLINVLNTEKLKPDEQAELYDKIAIRYGSSSNFKKAIEYAEKGMNIAFKIKDWRLASSFNSSIGVSYFSMGDYIKAYPYLEEALRLAVKSKDKKEEAGVHISIGAYYGRQGQYIRAQEHFMSALAISESIEDKKQCIDILGNIGIIYLTLNNLEKAVACFKRGIDLAEEINQPRLKVRFYHELARHYVKIPEFDVALEYAFNTVELSRKYNLIIFEALGLGVVADIYVTMGEYEKALTYLQKSIPVSEKTNDPTILANNWKLMSDIYLKQGQFVEAEQIAQKSWALDSIGLAIKSDLLFTMAYSNLFMDNKKKAGDYLIAYAKAMEELSDKNSQEILVDMEVKYETEKKELQIASLEKERQLYIWLGLVGLLLAIALAAILWQKSKNARKEKQLIATRSVLDGEMSERSRLARDLHDRLSGNLSAVKMGLDNNKESLQLVYDKLDNCIEEIRRVAHNLMPTSLQYGMKVALEDFAAQFDQVHFHFFGEEKQIEERKKFIIYCCANELVTNSLRHSCAKNINVQLVQDDKHVTLTVQDDGCGYDENLITKGMGLKSIYDRVMSCNAKMDIITSPGNGTETTIELKIENI